MIIEITDPDDPRIEAYRDIKERDLVKNKKQFIAEGKTVLAVLLKQKRFEIVSLLILQNRLSGLAPLVDNLAFETPIYVVTKAVMDAIAGFSMHRGVLALARRPSETDQSPTKQQAQNWRRLVCLADIANHDNIGSIFRNAAAFEADAVLLNAGCCDPLYRKALRVSVGGILTTPYHIFETTHAMLSWLEDNYFSTFALSPSGSQTLANWSPPAKAAILMGAEGPGLPQSIMEKVPTLKISMSNRFDSLNVATATGIVLHHIYTKDKA